MNSIEKTAAYTPAELFALTGMLGGGGFATIKLLQEMQQRAQHAQLSQDANSLAIHIPEKKKDHQQHNPAMLPDQPMIAQAGEEPWYDQKIHNASGAVLGMAGLPAGFLGTQAIYEAYKNHQFNSQLEAEKKKYNDALYQAKFGEHTPAVDSFCSAVSEGLNKQADVTVPRVPMSDVVNAAPHPNLAYNAMNFLGMGTPDLATDAWKTLAGGAGVATLAVLIAKRRSKERKEQQQQYPTRATLQPI